MGFLSDLFFGKKSKTRRESVLNDAQEQLLEQLIQEIMGGTQFSEDQFQQGFVDPALKQFNEQTAPGIQQRLIAGGEGRSSALENLIARAGTDVQSDLNQKRAGLFNAASDRRANQFNTALGTNSFGIIQEPGTKGLFGELIGGAVGGFGGSAGRAAGNRFGFR